MAIGIMNRVLSAWVFVAVFSLAGASFAKQTVSANGENIILEKVGDGSGDGHLVSIQPYLRTEDMRTTQTFKKRINHYFQVAKAQGAFDKPALVVLPELIGLYMYFSNGPDAVYKQKDLMGAGVKMALSKILQVVAQPPLILPGEPMNLGGLFNRKLINYLAPEVARNYQRVFSELAQQYKVYISAGSLPLPGPFVDQDGFLQPDKKQHMRNVAVLFQPDGRIHRRLTIKAFPTKSEAKDLFIKGGPVQALPIYSLPLFGRTAIVICADTWYPETFTYLKAQKVRTLVSGSNLGPVTIGDEPWKGYNSPQKNPTPQDVNLLDVGWLTEWQAWQKYAMLGRIDNSEAVYGISSFMKGDLWHEKFYGAPFVVTPDFRFAMTNEDLATIAIVEVQGAN